VQRALRVVRPDADIAAEGDTQPGIVPRIEIEAVLVSARRAFRGDASPEAGVPESQRWLPGDRSVVAEAGSMFTWPSRLKLQTRNHRIGWRALLLGLQIQGAGKVVVRRLNPRDGPLPGPAS